MADKALKKAAFHKAIFVCIALSFGAISCQQDEENRPAVKTLEKSFEIKTISALEEPRFFWQISSICFDNDGNLYVADSGWNQVFKFNSDGEYMGSFGRQGQGPGEFLANPRLNTLRITFGNNKKFYVYDPGNNRISVFSESFVFEKSFTVSSAGPRILDTPDVNSNGDIFLVGYDGGFLIQCFDQQFSLKARLLDSNQHFRSDFFDLREIARRRLTSEYDLGKEISADDHLVVLSNYTLCVYIFDQECILIREFSVARNKEFMRDFEKRVDQARKKKGQIFPFSLHLDNEGNICLGYFHGAVDNWVIYRYSQTGQFIDTLITRERIFPPFVSDREGSLYALNSDRTALTKYQIVK
jgi:hypothetical protein